MTARPSSKQKGTLVFTVLLISACVFCLGTVQVMGQDGLTLSLTRNFGMGFGSSIQGTFTVHGSGPESIERLVLYFNKEEVHNADSNTMNWQFNTGDYEAGTTNITLAGWDADENRYTTSLQYNFIGESVSTVITIAIISIVVVLVLVKYGPLVAKTLSKDKSGKD